MRSTTLLIRMTNNHVMKAKKNPHQHDRSIFFIVCYNARAFELVFFYYYINQHSMTNSLSFHFLCSVIFNIKL
jgi:hypothetical protein